MSELTDLNWKRFIPTLNQRPTQPPLDRTQQQSAYEQLKQSYFTERPPVPSFPLAPAQELKLSETQQLQALRDQMKERGLQMEVKAVETRLEEKKTADTVKQFYCTHTFQTVNAKFGILPIRYKICSKCGLVK
jgi:hypothetical protein